MKPITKMTKSEASAFVFELSKTNKKVCFNINEIGAILFALSSIDETIPVNTTLKTGLYSKSCGMEIYGSPLVRPGTYWNEEKYNSIMVLK